MTTPDRFEIIANDLPEAYDGFPSCVRRVDIAPLLRREHHAVVRAVEKLIVKSRDDRDTVVASVRGKHNSKWDTLQWDSERMAYEKVLAMLERGGRNEYAFWPV